MDTGRNRGQMGHFGGRLASWRWKQSEEILPRYVFRAGFFRLKHSAHIGHVRHQVIEHMDHGVDELVEVPSSVDRKPLCCLARPESRTCAQLVQFLREFGGTGSSSVRAGMMPPLAASADHSSAQGPMFRRFHSDCFFMDSLRMRWRPGSGLSIFPLTMSVSASDSFWRQKLSLRVIGHASFGHSAAYSACVIGAFPLDSASLRSLVASAVPRYPQTCYRPGALRKQQ